MLPTKFQLIWPSSFRGEDLCKSTNQKQKLPVVAMFTNGSDKMSNVYRETSIDASYQVSVHLPIRFQRRRFLVIDQSETKIACGGHVFNESGQN